MTDTPKPRSPAWVRVLLVASLAMNFVFVGLASGVAFSVAKGQSPGFARLLGPVMKDLPPEVRTQMRREVMARRSELKETRESVRRADEAARMAITAEPFDLAALEAALVARAEAVEAAMLTLNEPILSLVSDLTAEQRQDLASALEKHRNEMAKDDGRFFERKIKASQ